MTPETQDRRHSVPETPVIQSDEKERASLETRNTLRQYDDVKVEIDKALSTGKTYRLRPSTVLQLHRAALEGLVAEAGTYRSGGMTIQGSGHNPPPAAEVPELLEEMCDYINEKWEDSSALHLASYVLWRLNWIHPFVDGNGRTSRAVSYLILCVRLGYRIPGTTTIPDRIVENRDPYYDALSQADRILRDDEAVDVSSLEGYLKELLSAQLLEVVESAASSN